MMIYALLFLSLMCGIMSNPVWDNDHKHVLSTSKYGGARNKDEISTYGDYISNPGEGEKTDWNEQAQRKIREANEKLRKTISLDKPAKNVIFMMGDGMGVSTITAGRVYLAQSRGIIGEEAILSWEKMPHVALSRTYAIDVLTADSACTATAMMCGEKARETIICGNQHVISANCTSLHDNKLKSMLHASIEAGKMTGIISTARITHASPATTYAHAAHRDWEADSDLPPDNDGCSDIASQLIDEELNKKINVILGGGRKNFLPETESDPEYPSQSGVRTDGRNLIQEWQDYYASMGLKDHEYKYVDRLSDFEDINPEEMQHLFGLFEPGHMHYEYDRPNTTMNPLGEPSLADMVEMAIRMLEKSYNGYFLFVEGGRVDTAHHDNNAFRALNDTAALSDAVQRALDLTSEDDTLIVVTADHSHVFNVAGYPAINTNIFSYNSEYERSWGYQIADDEKAYTTLQYANGPGYYMHRTYNGTLNFETPRINLTDQESLLVNPSFIQDAGVPLMSETHGGEDVAIFARGPMAHLFDGVQEQNYIAHVMKYALCVGDNKELCESPPDAVCATSGAAKIFNSVTLLFILHVIL